MSQIRTGLKDISEKNQQLIRASQFDFGGQTNSVAMTNQQPMNTSDTYAQSSLDIVQQNYAGFVE